MHTRTWLDKTNIENIKRICLKMGSTIEIIDDEKLIIEINRTKHLIRSYEEIEIFYSIYLMGEYNIVLPFDFVLIDVGMNVGFTSLFFAQQANVTKIIGFEPMSETYRCLQENLALNPDLAQKIIPYNFGLGGTTRRQTVEYCFTYKGGVGILGLPSDIKASAEFHEEEICIKDAGETLEQIIGQGLQENYVIKMDCEGAEYEIFENETFRRLLRKVRVIMLEYHRLGYQIIKERLETAGYEVLLKTDELGINGMIYAVNKLQAI